MCAYYYINITIRFYMKIDSSVKIFFFLYSHIFQGVKYMAYESFMMHKNREMDGIDRNVKLARSEMKPLVRLAIKM